MRDPQRDPDEDEAFAGVPDNLRSLIEGVGFIDVSTLEGDAAEMLDPAMRGLCMTCGAEMGSSTVLLINQKGIGGAYCGGACMQDMAVLGWLQEEHDDIVDRVKFRGGNSDVAQAE